MVAPQFGRIERSVYTPIREEARQAKVRRGARQDHAIDDDVLALAQGMCLWSCPLSSMNISQLMPTTVQFALSSTKAKKGELLRKGKRLDKPISNG